MSDIDLSNLGREDDEEIYYPESEGPFFIEILRQVKVRADAHDEALRRIEEEIRLLREELERLRSSHRT